MKVSRFTLYVLLLASLILLSTFTRAQSDSGYNLTWSTINNGGSTRSESGSYTLSGTIGQIDAGVLSGGAYTLTGGFWSGAALRYSLHLPMVLRN